MSGRKAQAGEAYTKSTVVPAGPQGAERLFPSRSCPVLRAAVRCRAHLRRPTVFRPAPENSAGGRDFTMKERCTGPLPYSGLCSGTMSSPCSVRPLFRKESPFASFCFCLRRNNLFSTLVAPGCFRAPGPEAASSRNSPAASNAMPAVCATQPVPRIRQAKTACPPLQRGKDMCAVICARAALPGPAFPVR